MIVGITGHQKRAGIDWSWVKDSVSLALSELPRPLIGFSSLAEGADQVFAEAVLALGGQLRAVLPVPDYGALFEGEAKHQYLGLVSRAEVIQLSAGESHAQSFENAGRYIAQAVEILFAVWDGKPALDRGGTGQIVDYALKLHTKTLRFDPFARAVFWL